MGILFSRYGRLIKEKEQQEQREQQKQLSNLYIKEQKLQQKQIHNLTIEIDKFIRKRKYFDGNIPLKYKCAIDSIDLLDIYLKKINQIYKSNNISFIDFVKNEERFIVDNDNNISLKYLTPFQGKKNHRVFGYFKCNKCNNKWKSKLSWTNKWQKCKKCKNCIYPYDQHMLDNEFKIQNKKIY